MAHATGADTTEGQVVLGNVEQRVIHRDSARHDAVDIVIRQLLVFAERVQRQRTITRIDVVDDLLRFVLRRPVPDDPVLIEFSPDNGVSWETVVSGQVGPYNWTVPETPTEFAIVRVTSLTDGSLVDTVQFSIDPAPLSIQTLQTGNWSDPATWDGNVIPTSADNVIIGSGHIITVDADASCLDLSFVDGSGRLGMQADLRLFGDFNRFGTSDNPFYEGSHLWADGAKMIFTGDAEVQAITGLGATSTSPYPLRFQTIVVDKSSGKLTTNPVEGTEAGYRLGIGVSLEILSGTFELGKRDDIEGRSSNGNSATPTITVQAGSLFKMLGSYSHIRRGNWTGNDTSKIGKMTVFGEAYVACSSSNRANFGDIDVEELANMTPGMVGADLANLVNEAALLTVRAGKQTVEKEQFEEAVERVVAGLEKKNRLINPKERKIVAYHELGHALVALSLPGTDPVKKITIVPRGIAALGYTMQVPTEDRFLMMKTELLAKIASLLGGRAAEEMIFKSQRIRAERRPWVER